MQFYLWHLLRLKKWQWQFIRSDRPGKNEKAVYDKNLKSKITKTHATGVMAPKALTNKFKLQISKPKIPFPGVFGRVTLNEMK